MIDQSRNLTWVIGDWRFYVARVDVSEEVKAAHHNPDLERWQWNVRKNPVGWEEWGQTDGGREAAIVEGLSVMEAVDADQYVTNYYITSPGLDTTVAAKPTMLISDFIPLALKATGHANYNPDHWEITGEGGHIYPRHLPIGVTSHRPISLDPLHMTAI